jgi:predicted lactoylglutathione lyase
MATQIFVNLPVKALDRSVQFFTKLGFSFNPDFTDDKATCMVVGEHIFVMLLTEPFFKTFTAKALCDPTRQTEAIVCLSMESRDAVTSRVQQAVDAGGRVYAEPKDHGFMFQHGFEDPDGHLWELVWMDPNFNPKDPQA